MTRAVYRPALDLERFAPALALFNEYNPQTKAELRSLVEAAIARGLLPEGWLERTIPFVSGIAQARRPLRDVSQHTRFEAVVPILPVYFAALCADVPGVLAVEALGSAKARPVWNYASTVHMDPDAIEGTRSLGAEHPADSAVAKAFGCVEGTHEWSILAVDAYCTRTLSDAPWACSNIRRAAAILRFGYAPGRHGFYMPSPPSIVGTALAKVTLTIDVL